jgi:hypothetical protein
MPVCLTKNARVCKYDRERPSPFVTIQLLISRNPVCAYGTLVTKPHGACVSHRPRSSTKENDNNELLATKTTLLLARHDIHVTTTLLLALDRTFLGAGGGGATEQVI